VWYELEVIESFAQVDPFTLVVTPYLPFAGTLLGAAVVGAFAIWNRKRGNVETRAPDVNEIWQKQAHDALELDREYRWRRRLQNFCDELLRTFRAYVKRVQAGGSTELTKHEQMFMESDTPTSEINTQ
jgi:hypothetical protein